ncbi:MAG: DNA-directed RNA polymerase subunit beta, partial [bacterium]
MDQTNPLAEMTHKRRLSALGPGGLHRKRAGFEVRDVHHTHYGRICPIETPEGPNIGLITSLACFARVNEYGLIESPYRQVERGKVQRSVLYLSAEQEDEARVAQANAEIDKNDRLCGDLVSSRYKGDFPMVAPHDVDYMDISPMQVVSVSTSLIPFLEHDDANRALMGSNMQRQAVPLMLTERPLVGTGIEPRVAKDSGSTIVAKNAGKVITVSADQISIWRDETSTSKSKDDTNIDIYNLKKYVRSNQDTCINQIPLVSTGDIVKKGQIITDGPAVSGGELALGKNLLVGFMPWEGNNFEDAILLNERLVKEDVLTSIHIQEYQVEARDTKMGPEEITRDIPNVGAESLMNLDETGIIRIGAEVGPGDILVGKVAPKGEQQVTPEERLLKVIFGKKSEDVQDSSLRVPPGVEGKVLGVKVFTRKEKLTRKEENAKIREIDKKLQTFIQELRQEKKQKLIDLKKHLDDKKIKTNQFNEDKENINLLYQKRERGAKQEYTKQKELVRAGDELPVTVNQVVKVYIVARRKVQVGDKLAGRHGNKGVVAKIIPQEEMPFLPDGTPLDVVLSPLSVPSRMNVGQLLETMLGWACKVLDIEAITPIFDGATEAQIKEMYNKAKDKLRKQGMPGHYLPDEDGKITMYDGRTGNPFSSKVTIGYMYLLKLAHLVEDKIHARSTGPYSLITRQPLGGKAQFGGQRFGEMEVWAVEGYGAAYTLREFLTVKSDDVNGRTKMYEAIIKGESYSESGVPESFKVLVKELQALGLSIKLLKKDTPDGKEVAKTEEDKIQKSEEKIKAG